MTTESAANYEYSKHFSETNQTTLEKRVPIMSDKLFNDDLIGYFAMSHWNLVI